MTDISPAKIASIAADAIYLSNRPLPNAPTGYYDWQISTDTSNDTAGHSRVTNLINRIETFKAKGGFQPELRKVDAFFDTFANPQSIDDRKGAFADGLSILARIDGNSDLAKKINDQAIATLYTTVPHPPDSYLGHQHVFRQADGGGNNPHYPDIGRAGTPYARSVQGKAGLPRTSLPDAGLIFDSILKRRGIASHDGGMSSLIFGYASIVSHSLFRTDTKNIFINNASSYLDLSPLYGDNQAAQDKVRDKAKGRGLLYPDTFSEERLFFVPPAANVLLVLFSRNHNYIADKLLKINERKRWSDPPPTDPVLLAQQDEEIFQTARLVNCGHFMSSIMGDYVGSFLGKSEGCEYELEAFDIIDKKDLKVDRGKGNHCSVEFNVLYRWHATIADEDLEWTENLFRNAFGDKPFDQLSLKDFHVFAQILAQVPANPAERTFAGLKRGPDGKFSDDDLANIIYTATESPACAYRGRGTPAVLRLVEIMGIEQARTWGVCTMNEFRQFLGLKKFATFEEWNPDPEIAGAARRLYGHVDNLELYTGIQAEATIPLSYGFHFAAGYTLTRGVLGDAIALVRGDRFNTTDLTPANLTTWGYDDCQREKNNGSGGCQIPRLLFRHLPRHFPWNSVYSHFPFFTPAHMKEGLTARKQADKYTFDHPTPLQTTKVLNTFTAIKTVFNDPARFKSIYVKLGYGSILMFDDVSRHDAEKAMVLHAVFPEKDSLAQHVAWFSASVKEKIQERTFQYTNVQGNYIDIVGDVINVVSAHWAADKLMGIELKTKSNPKGIFTENEFFDMLKTLYNLTLLTFDDPGHHFAFHEAGTKVGGILGALTAKTIIEISPTISPNLIGRLAARAAALNPKPSYPFLNKMAASGKPLDQLLGNILGLAVGSSVNYAQAATNVIDFYLDDARAKEREHIIELVRRYDTESATLLSGYVYEAMRLKPQFPVVYREAAVDAVVPQGPGLPEINIKAGERICASFRNAHLNPQDFPEPETVNPRRPLSSYNLNGTGFHNCPGTSFSLVTITEIVKAVFQLKNVRRAPGDAGRLHCITETIQETETDFFIQRNGTLSSWPGSLFIAYDPY